MICTNTAGKFIILLALFVIGCASKQSTIREDPKVIIVPVPDKPVTPSPDIDKNISDAKAAAKKAHDLTKEYQTEIKK